MIFLSCVGGSILGETFWLVNFEVVACSTGTVGKIVDEEESALFQILT